MSTEQGPDDIGGPLGFPARSGRWGSSRQDTRTPEEKRAAFALDVEKWRRHIADKGFVPTPGGPLRVPVELARRSPGGAA